MADQLATLAQVKLRLFPAGTTDTADDAMLTEMIEQVSDWIQHYTGRRFVPDSDATHVFDTYYGSVVRIPQGIRLVTSMGVARNHQPDVSGTYTTIPAADILLRPRDGDRPFGWPATEIHLTRGTLAGTVRTFGRYDNGVTVTGDFGFASTPPDIQAVTIDAVTAAYSQRRSGVSGIVGADDVSLSPWQRFFGRGSLQRALLDRYAYLALA